jgi:hypothetical protein
MQNKEFNVTWERLTFFETLSFFVETKNIVEYLKTSFEIVLQEYEIDEDRIVNLDFDKVKIRTIIGVNFEDVENQENVFLVKVKFCKFDREKLNDQNQENRIRTVLNYKGYSDSDIRGILYRKYWSNSDELVWVAEVRDEIYNNFTLDESYSAREYESDIMSQIEDILGFQVVLSFI